MGCRGAGYCHRGAVERSNISRAQLLAIRKTEPGKIVERAEAALRPSAAIAPMTAPTEAPACPGDRRHGGLAP